MSHLDDMNTVGKFKPNAAAFQQLRVDDDGVRSIGLQPRLPKCGIYGGDKELVAAKAAKLRTAQQRDCFTAVGSPLGSAENMSNALGRRAATVETLVDTLVQLPLFLQSHFLLLSASLHAWRNSCGWCPGRRSQRTRAVRALECVGCGGRARLAPGGG